MRNLLLTLLLFLLPTGASARDHRVPQLPHGDRFGCTSCHTSPAGGGVFTRFGSDTLLALVGTDLVQQRDLDWSLVYHLDSDRDGFTNGEELNDPNGQWRIGDPDPIGGVVFNPGDPSSHPLATCGDGRVTPPEECDGTNHREQTCIGLGLDDGVLTCNADCTFDRSGCGESPLAADMGQPPTDSPDPPAEDAACSSSNGESTMSLLALFLAFIVLRRRTLSKG